MTKKTKGGSNSRDYDVGYGKPPKHTQFRKGQSGNPKGRKKGHRSMAGYAGDILASEIAVRKGGVLTKMSFREAFLRDWANKAMQGNAREKAAFLDYLNEHYPDVVDPPPPKREPILRGRPQLIVPERRTSREPAQPDAVTTTQDDEDWLS